MEEMSLFGDDTIQYQFERFHGNHPEVYDALRALAYRAKDRGRTKLSIKMLFEVVRWEWTISGLPDESELWKLNNNYHSRYARLLMRQDPALAGIFETRVLTAR